MSAKAFDAPVDPFSSKTDCHGTSSVYICPMTRARLELERVHILYKTLMRKNVDHFRSLSARLQISTLFKEIQKHVSEGLRSCRPSSVTLVIELLELFLPLVESLGGQYETLWVPRLGDLYYALVESIEEPEMDSETAADPKPQQLTSAATGAIMSR
jgi:hypothetical protein